MSQIKRVIAVFICIAMFSTMFVSCGAPAGGKGEQGIQGEKGETGIGILSTTIDDNGNFVITYTDGTVEIIEHNWNYLYTLQAPTCNKEGIDFYICTDCEFVRAIMVQATGHNFGDWITIKEPTAFEEGLKEKNCACGEKKTQTIDKLAIQESVGLAYALNNDGKSYSVIGIDTCTDVNIVIPSTYNDLPVTSIASLYSSNIVSITIPESVTNIEDGAFNSCTSLKTVSIPNSVVNIGTHAFADCTSLESIVIPKNVTSIGRQVFLRCVSLQNIAVHRDNPTYHSSDNCLIETASQTLIAGCKTSVIPTDGSVTRIGDTAFARQHGLESIAITKGITSIDRGAFVDCKNLRSIVISDSVKTIGNSAFNGSSALEMITFNGTIEQWQAINKDSSWDYNTGTYIIYCTDGEMAKDGTVTYY